MPDPVAAELEARPAEQANTIPVFDLIQRAQVDRKHPPPGDLIDWLIAERLAVRVGNRLAPTELARQVGATLEAIELDSAANR